MTYKKHVEPEISTVLAAHSSQGGDPICVVCGADDIDDPITIAMAPDLTPWMVCPTSKNPCADVLESAAHVVGWLEEIKPGWFVDCHTNETVWGQPVFVVINETVVGKFKDGITAGMWLGITLSGCHAFPPEHYPYIGYVDGYGIFVFTSAIGPQWLRIATVAKPFTYHTPAEAI